MVSLPISKTELYFYIGVCVTQLPLAFYFTYQATFASENLRAARTAPSQYSFLYPFYYFDNYDYEWKTTRTFFIPILKNFILHSMVWKCMHYVFNPKLANQVISLLSFILMIYHINSIKLPFFIIALSIIVIIITRITKKELPSWIIIIACLLKLKFGETFGEDTEDNFVRAYQFYSYTMIKIVNVAIYIARNKDTQLDRGFFIRVLHYLFYLPYGGILIVLFEDFCDQLNQIEDPNRIKKNGQEWSRVILLGGFRLLFGFMITELILHLIHPCSLSYMNNDVFSHLLPAAMFSLSLFKCVFFYTKYLVIFGLNIYFAEIDEMNPPQRPVCVVTIGRFSNIWRGFDRGLYQFLLRQIYTPLMGKREESSSLLNTCKRTFGMVASFVFVLVWHGFKGKYVCWVTLSGSELLLERIGLYITSTNSWKSFAAKIGPQNTYRLTTASFIFSIIPGLFGIFFFLSGEGNGYITFKSIVVDGFIELIQGKAFKSYDSNGFTFICLIGISYFYSHSCRYFEDKESLRKKIKKSKML